jgi:hypothetical protein
MQVKDFPIVYTRANSEFKIYPFGCIHGGTIHCAEDKAKAKVAEIAKDKNAFWVGMGDLGEFIAEGDKRWDPSIKAIAPWVEQDDVAESQRKWITNLLDPIRKQCVGLLYGNHEEAIRKFLKTNVHKHICEDLGVDNLGYSCFIRLKFERENSNERHLIKVCATHGAGAAITRGAKMNRLERFMNSFESRIYFHGHVHDIIENDRPYIYCSDQGKIKQKLDIGLMTGCWFRTYTQGIQASYGEAKNYPPTVIGCPYILINPEKDEIRAII